MFFHLCFSGVLVWSMEEHELTYPCGKGGGCHLSERVIGRPTLFRSHFSNFLSSLGRVVQIFRPL